MKPKETAEHYILSSSPHAHADVSVRRLMLDGDVQRKGGIIPDGSVVRVRQTLEIR